MLKNLKKKKKGFTLIELIIVIAIIAILAAVAIPKFGQVKKDANIKSDIANAKTIANAATSLMAEGSLATDTTGTKVEKAASGATTFTNGNKIADYLQNVPDSESVSGGFYILIDADGNVTVKAGNATTGTIYFPAP